MSVKKISEAILGVGVDDTTIDLFESQYPVPTGVSYNSYVILDETIKNRHPYTKALLSAIPIADPTIERERKRILLQGDVPSPVNLPQGCNFCNRCPYATQLCKERKPQLREIEPGHFTACHRAEEM